MMRQHHKFTTIVVSSYSCGKSVIPEALLPLESDATSEITNIFEYYMNVNLNSNMKIVIMIAIHWIL